jgi:hypothetical protein
MAAAVKTTRRPLRFETIADVQADLDKIQAAHQAGRLRATGNWTPGQILAHVAAWIDYAYDGYPMKPLPAYIQWGMRFVMRKLIRDGLKPGVRIPGIKGGTTGADAIPTEEGIERLRHSLTRLSSGEVVRFGSPAFGKMSPEECVGLTLRHAELHLSFLAID